MIKVDLDYCSPGEYTSGQMILEGNPNQVLNEVAALVKHVIMKEPAIQAIEDGISQAMEELNND